LCKKSTDFHHKGHQVTRRKRFKVFKVFLRAPLPAPNAGTRVTLVVQGFFFSGLSGLGFTRENLLNQRRPRSLLNDVW
jgi:hypothetical protein